MGLEVLTADVLYKKTDEALMLRRYPMAAKYAFKCLSEIEDIRDESQRAASIISLAGAHIQEAETLNADVDSAKELISQAYTELKENKYSQSVDLGIRCIDTVKQAKEQRVMDVISSSRAIIDDFKSNGKDVFNAEVMLKEAEIVIGYEDYFKALKLAMMGESEVGKMDIQRGMVPDIINRINSRLADVEERGMASDSVRLHIQNAKKAQSKNDFLIAMDYAILGIKELSEITEDYERASISLLAAQARLNEVSETGLEINQIKDLFEEAKKEFMGGNHSLALKLVKETIDNSKQLYKEHLIKPIGQCEQLVKTAEDLGADITRANNILIEAKAALDEELFPQVPLFLENCQKIAEREIKKHLFERFSQVRKEIERAQGKGMDASEASKMLDSGESSLENKNYIEAADYLQKCVDALKV
jgi:hypothetical protein